MKVTVENGIITITLGDEHPADGEFIRQITIDKNRIVVDLLHPDGENDLTWEKSHIEILDASGI